ncbi:arylalkylamine N-acetyltransferase 1 [Phlebotomus argentipes]|uniref:arylalkylamine N-acetyltransferase 1 n=1 Tax=Phlebotomus argentipes TaxID=94469 RepID=UPI0028935498|nr:arylalkylamine N-acetyltransferase 1 [Phlebotomus argentipes]
MSIFDNGPMKIELRQIPANSDRLGEIIIHLRNTFFADEPLNRAVKLCRPGEGHLELERHSEKTLRDGLSVMAVTDENVIAGVALNGILRRGEVRKALDALKDTQDERFKKIFRLLYEENLKTDFFDSFGVEKIFEIRILSVDCRFRGQGLAKKLMEKSQEVARENGFKLMKTDATGLFSQKTFSSLGFSTKSEYLYSLENGKVADFMVEPPHDKLKIMYKVLD